MRMAQLKAAEEDLGRMEERQGHFERELLSAVTTAQLACLWGGKMVHTNVGTDWNSESAGEMSTT